MRVALVSPYDLTVPGGVQSHVRHLAAALRAGHADTGRPPAEVVLLGPGPLGVTHDADGTATIGLGPSRGVAANGSVAPVALGPGAALRTHTVLERLRPDVVHVHEPAIPIVGPVATSHRRAPVVVTCHAWSSDDRAYRAVAPAARRLLDRAAARVAVSPAAAEYHARALGGEPSMFDIIPNGVDLPRFQQARRAVRAAAGGDPDRARATPGDGRIVFVGRLEPRKGAVVLADAFLELLRTHPGATLTVIGEGPQAAALDRRLDGLPAGQVHRPGRVDGEALARALAEADVAVAPALGGESFGIVLLEAMAAGTAVVASDIPGYRSVVTHGRNGVLVPPGEPGALAQAMAGLLDDRQRRTSLVAAGERTADAHGWDHIATRLLTLYRACVTAPTGRATRT